MRNAFQHGVKFLGRRAGTSSSANNDAETSGLGKKVAVISTAAMAMVSGDEGSVSNYMIEDAADSMPAHAYKRPIEELVKLPYVSDYERLHLGSLIKFNLKSPGNWRMSTVNEDYSICKRYIRKIENIHNFFIVSIIPDDLCMYS